jgi:hypothetical protein
MANIADHRIRKRVILHQPGVEYLPVTVGGAALEHAGQKKQQAKKLISRQDFFSVKPGVLFAGVEIRDSTLPR